MFALVNPLFGVGNVRNNRLQIAEQRAKKGRQRHIRGPEQRQMAAVFYLTRRARLSFEGWGPAQENQMRSFAKIAAAAAIALGAGTASAYAACNGDTSTETVLGAASGATVGGLASHSVAG